MRLAVVCFLVLSITPMACGQRYGETPPLPLAQPSMNQGAATRSVSPLAQPVAQGGANGNRGNPASNSRPPRPLASPPPAAASNPGSRDYARSAAPARPAKSGYNPSALMRGMLRAPSDSRLVGQPVRLEQVVAGSQSRAEQTQRIYAYWDLCSSTADYYLGLIEAEELRRLRQRSGANSAALTEAANRWRTRIGTSQLAAQAAQQRLASMIGSDSLPLPADPPLCGAYRTRYAQAFAGRASQEARGLDQLIPLRFAEMSAAADGVSRAQDFAESVKQRDPAGEGMIKALELLALNRRAFVQIAKDYNRQITRYTELSTPGRLDTNRLVAMLVERPRNNSTASQSRPLTFRPGRQ